MSKIDMPKQMAKANKASTLCEELQATEDSREGRTRQLVVQCPEFSHENIHINRLYGPNQSYLEIYMYTHIHIFI